MITLWCQAQSSEIVPKFVADSVETTGLKWVAPAGGGKVLQVINATTTSGSSTASSSFIDTGLTANITPSATNSKVLILVSQNGLGKSSANTQYALRLVRGATEISVFENFGAGDATSGFLWVGGNSICYLDSPSTTSSTTYKTQFRNRDGSGTVYIQEQNSMSSITLLEIGA
jgi:hypothetical protein